ncbi:MAG: hypothetical protein Q7K40_00205 [bacterium]|nr:hypothetical protein [bacterium]
MLPLKDESVLKLFLLGENRSLEECPKCGARHVTVLEDINRGYFVSVHKAPAPNDEAVCNFGGVFLQDLVCYAEVLE